MHNPKRVYLSGGMEYSPDEGKSWRQELQTWLQQNLGCEVFNPKIESDNFLATQYPSVDMRALKHADIVTYASIVAHLVELDCREIAGRSELVICYWDEAAMRGAGTKGELTIARHFGKPVYMVTSMPYNEIPGWVLGCTTMIFSSFDELKEFLLM